MIDWQEFKEECCVVIPVYKENLVFFEQASLMQCVRVLGQKYDIYLVAPYNLDLSPYTSLCSGYRFKVKRLAKGFFEGLDGYNQLCKRWEFYDSFSDYNYMLIYQLDCWIFNDNIEYFTSLGYDFIGAPWITIKDNQITSVECGNGGFSLRKIEKLRDVCKENPEVAEDKEVPEDIFFCKKCGDKIKVCPPEIGREFSFEVGPSVFFKLNGEKLPLGCHKPYLFEFKNFWKDYIKF